MRRNLKTLLSVTAVIGALATGPALYAHADTKSQEQSGGMMQDGPGGMMDQGGMMNMMGQMSQMMENCNKMMQSMHQGGSGKPNEQWRGNAPETHQTPEKEG